MLQPNELHYLKRVLRLSIGEYVEVVDGEGVLLKAVFHPPKYLRFESISLLKKSLYKRPSPLICLAIAIPKRGFDQALRMCTEIGVDKIQPLLTERTNSNLKINIERSESIIRNAVEQSERLWKPELLEVTTFNNLTTKLKGSSALAIAITRGKKINQLSSWLTKYSLDLDEIWIAVGPEGGWSPEELLTSFELGWSPVEIGDSIFRTSTAGVLSTYIMSDWRRNTRIKH